MEVVWVGDVPVMMQFKAVLYDVLLVPKLACNLFSVRAATRKGRFETAWENFMVWARLEETPRL